MLLTNDDIIDRLLSETGYGEKSRSAYWEQHGKLFELDRDGNIYGTTNLGYSAKRRSGLRRLAHRVLQLPIRHFARKYKTLRECERMGEVIAARQNRLVNFDFLRHVLTLALIREHIDLSGPGDANLVIGDGFATMTTLLMEAAPQRRAIIANLTKPLVLDVVHIRKAFPDAVIALVTSTDEMREALDRDDIRVIVVQADNADVLKIVPIRLAVNMESMQEMDLPVVASYFKLLRTNPATKTAFYCCNRRFKTSNFEEYPWRELDHIFVHGVCDWSQLYYSKKPPFWHRRTVGPKIVWHRLAELCKSPDQESADDR